MALNVNASQNRSGANDRKAREIPETVVKQIIDDVEKTSIALQLGEVHRMNTFQERYRLVNTKPKAYWLNGVEDRPGSNGTGLQSEKDSALKQTSSYGYDNLTITPDEIAVQIVMPDSWMADSDLAWEEVRSHVRGAFAEAIDAAVLYGRSLTAHNLPSTFGPGIIPRTVTLGKVVNEGFKASGAARVVANGEDLSDTYAELAQELEERGYDATDYVVSSSEEWRLKRLRDKNNQPILVPLTAGPEFALHGLPLREVNNGIWDKTVATAIVGDWANLKIGIRQDMQFTMSNSAVITNQAGAVQYNAYQQDGQVLRACMRLGYLVTDPFRNLTGGREWPFQVMVPANNTAS